MKQLSKAERAQEIDLLQRALVRFSSATNDRAWENKTEVERSVATLANALLMELHKEKDEQGLPQQPVGKLPPAEQLANKLLSVSNALRGSETPVASDVVAEFSSALDMLDLAHSAKNAGKTMLAKDKLKGLGD